MRCFFKGLLSALICEDCLRSLLLMCFEKMVDSFEIKKMNCPKCRTRLKCQDTRQRPGNVRYRLYECPKCDYRVTSTERIDFEKSKRIKNNSWHDLLKGINWNMLKWNDKYYDYNFELPIIREDGAFSTRSINSNTQKAHDQYLVMGFLFPFSVRPWCGVFWYC